MLAEVEARLPAICTELFGSGARIAHLREISPGAENHIFTLDVERPGDSPLALIFKLYSGEELYARREIEVMRKLPAQGFPVPRLFHGELDLATFGRPFSLMQRIEGATMAARIQAAQGGVWLDRFAELVARLHALDAAAFVPTLKSADEYLDDVLARHQQSLRELEVPEFQPVFDWLLEQRRGLAARGPALIHHDYHPFNIMVDRDDALYVIDWSSAHVCDPRCDLAQTFQLFASAGYGASRPVIVAAYEAVSGGPLGDMAFFDVFALLKNLAGQYAVLDDGEHKRPTLWARLARRPNWSQRAAQLPAAIPVLRRTYQAMTALCGVRVPEAERLLAVPER